MPFDSKCNDIKIVIFIKPINYFPQSTFPLVYVSILCLKLIVNVAAIYFCNSNIYIYAAYKLSLEVTLLHFLFLQVRIFVFMLPLSVLCYGTAVCFCKYTYINSLS